MERLKSKDYTTPLQKLELNHSSTTAKKSTWNILPSTVAYTKKRKPPSLLSLCIGVVGIHLEDIVEDLPDIAFTLPSDIKMKLMAVAKRKRILNDDVIIALADSSWEILDISGSNISDFGLSHIVKTCKSLRAVDISCCERLTLDGISELLQHCQFLETLRWGRILGGTGCNGICCWCPFTSLACLGVILTPPEDKHLCLVYMDVSQDPITSNNQTRKQFWSKVMQEYNSNKPNYIVEERNHRSVEDRMRTILKAVKKLRNCIRQVENRNQSGSSAKDIMDQAKRLMMEDKEFKKGFKFEHVWPILKDMEVFVEHDGDRASHLETPNSSSPALSSFSINLSDDSTGATTSKRPGGVKKAKTNAAHDEQMKAYAETLVKKTTVLADQMVRRQDYKIMMTDLNSITDPVSRAYILGEREKIMQRSGEQSNQDNTAGEFGQFFQDLNPSGDDLHHY